jgi:hypothetical protein
MTARRSRRGLVSSPSINSELRRLLRLLGESISRRVDRTFELSGAGAGRRRAQALLFAVLFLVLGFGLHMLLNWRAGVFAAQRPVLGSLLPVALLTVWRVLLMLGIAAWLGVQFGGRFVADIFEVKDARIAWKFIGDLATGARGEVLHLREGCIAEKDRRSPIVQIGGPGRVFVDFDTAALFEMPDGTPHVVGSSETGGNGAAPHGAGIVLEGFERLREPVVSLRDQYIGNPSGEPLTVVGRSQDGLPIGVMDVRGVFSLRRDGSSAGAQTSEDRPFPFRNRDVENLIYRQTVEVSTGGEHASGTPGEWTAEMHTMIRESVREFMGRNRLAEFLAGVGVNEAERSEFRSDTILSRTLAVSAESSGLPPVGTGSAVRFRPRTELSAKFRKYGSEFSSRAQESGLELHWIGVGTWKVPDESSEDAVNAKHVEAWRMHRENATRLQSDALERVSEAALLEHKLRLIQEVPLAKHVRNRARYSDKLVLMECLLQDFWEQLGDALDVQYRAGTPSTDLEELEETVTKIEQLLRISQMGHVLGGSTKSRVRRREEWDRTLEGPPAPASRAEALQYQSLLGKLKGDYRVAEAMIVNEKRRHGELTREQLISRIVERFERHGR